MQVQVSVILATYNRATKLAQCLKSIFNQTLSSDQYEVIVVDDGSLDETTQVLQRFQGKFSNFSFLRQSNQGPATARNRGVRQARAKIIAFTDDDCVVPSDWLVRLLDGLRRYPAVVAVGGYQEAPDPVLAQSWVARFERFQTREIYAAQEREVVGGMETPAVVTNNMIIRKEVFDELGGFDETFPVAAGEDVDLKKRVTDQGHRLLYLPIKVIHQQDYNLKGFLRQSYMRGIGSRHFQRKWGSDVGNQRLLVWLITRPCQRFWSVLQQTRSSGMALLAFLQEAYGLWGQLKYESSP